jgi:hypothetical protein
MCDYSLMGVPNRLARDGEELVLFTFPTGTKGFTQPASIACSKPSDQGSGLWQKLRGLFQAPNLDAVPAICIPPGARLMLQQIPADLRSWLKVSDTEQVTFTQLSPDADIHRDALRFGNGGLISLQALPEGLRIKILGLDLGMEAIPVQGNGLALPVGW